ncbi:MAG: YceI family protein [Verrucomicrobia bacterium]|nr:YceI family protein [Verrucomicrobiota bacterium]
MRTKRGLFMGGLALLFAAAMVAQAAEGWTEYRARPGTGSKVTIDGTSTVHDWTVEGLIIGGTVEVGPNFSTDPAVAKVGKVDLKSTVFIPVRSLKSMKEGKPYSTAMDDIMYGKLKMEEHKNIEFKLVSMTLKEAPKAGAPFLFEAEGELKVAGAAKTITMPVEMTAPEANRLKFSGKVTAKMTDFGIEPPAPTVGLGLIKTGDEIKLGFDWVVGKR